MSYSYAELKPKLFTDDGQRMFLKIRDRVRRLLDDAGAFQMERAWSGVTGDTWTMLACVDRLVELGEISELRRDCAGQYRTFVRINQ